MRPDPLLPGLPDVEAGLAGRACPELPAGLRERILAAVSAERRPASHRPSRNLWKFVGRPAAAVVLALNLAMSAVNGFRYESLHARAAGPGGFAPGRPQPGPAAPADADDRFQAFAASALTHLTAAPDAGAVAQRFLEQQEN